MSIEASMANYYAARAHEYERIYHKPERQADLRQLRTWVAELFAGLDVLELACGTGYWTEVISPAAASVLATDINEEVLAIARGKALNKVRFDRRDIYGLVKPAGRFNAGLAAFWWSHVPRQKLRTFLVQLHSQLTAGAKVVFIDNVFVQGSSTPISRTNDAGDTFQLRRLDDGSTHEVLKNFPTEPELRAATESLAASIRVEFLQYYWLLAYQIPL